MIESLFVLSGLIVLQAAHDSARIADGRLVVEPVGVSFEIPAGWLNRVVTSAGPSCDLNSAQARSVNIERAALRSLTGPSSYYGDQYYSAIADSVFAVDDLVAHLGARGWRDCDNYVADLQMRVYVSDAAPEAIGAKLPALRLSPFRGYSTPRLAASRDSSGWRIETLDWEFDCGDCVFAKRFEIYSRRVGVRTVSLVFMYMPPYPVERPEMKQRFADKQRILQSLVARGDR